MNDPAAGLSILHVIVRAGSTNSQYNEHCLPVLDTRRITVCSLFPADVVPPLELRLFEGDGSVPGCFRALRRALSADDHDVVHVHAPASAMVTLAVYLTSRLSRHNLVFTMHNSWANFRPRNRLFLRLVLALFPLVVFCGQAAHDSLPRRLRRRYEDKFEIVPNGVDVDRVKSVLNVMDGEGAPPPAPPPPEEAESERGRTVVSVGRLIPIKDPATMLDAFVRIRRGADRLLVVGDGPLRAELEEATHDNGLEDHVSFTGVVPRDDVYRMLATADVFVSTSTGEGLPVALLEAMACGCPVVASDIPPHREIAAAALAVPLVPVHDGPAFARALDRTLSMTEAERTRLEHRLRTCVAERFSVRAMNHAYGELYRVVAGRIAPTRRGMLRSAAVPPRHSVDVPLGDRLRRRTGLLAAFAVLGGAGGFLFAHVQAPVFKGETTLIVGGEAGAAQDEDGLKLSAALAGVYADLTRREPVLGPLVDLGFAESWRDLQDDVHAQVGDKNPQLVQISVYAGSAASAGRLADAVADSLLQVASRSADSPEQEFLDQQLRTLRGDIDRTTEELVEARSLADAAPPDKAAQFLARAEGLRSTLAEERNNYADLEALNRAEVAMLVPVDRAWTTRSPLRPTPLMLAAAGAAAGLVLVVGWVHLFDRGASPRPRRLGGSLPETSLPESPPGVTFDHRVDRGRPDRVHHWPDPTPKEGHIP